MMRINLPPSQDEAQVITRRLSDEFTIPVSVAGAFSALCRKRKASPGAVITLMLREFIKLRSEVPLPEKSEKRSAVLVELTDRGRVELERAAWRAKQRPGQFLEERLFGGNGK